MPTELALELYHLVIRHVDSQADLRSLALCCWAFRDEAQRCLFGYVKLNNFLRQMRFLSAINGASLRLGPLVHSFCIDVETLNGYNHLDSLSKALHAMSGLKHLKILRCRTPSEVLRGRTFRLLTLVCEDFLEDTEVFFLICDFLPTQTGIKHLEIYVWEPIDVSKVPIGLCPGLDCMGTNDNHLVSVLLPDTRTLSQFRWNDSNRPPPLTVHQLNHLKSLTFSISAFETDVSFTSHLTSLVNLEVRISLSNGAPFVHDVSTLFLINMLGLTLCVVASLFARYSTPEQPPP